MKEEYLRPEIDVEEYKRVDVITTSGDVQGDDNDVPFGS